jgi:hypothetical protein
MWSSFGLTRPFLIEMTGSPEFTERSSQRDFHHESEARLGTLAFTSSREDISMKSRPACSGFLALLFLPGVMARADITVSDGYYDLTQAQFPPGLPVPDPWYGSPNTTFYGNVGQATSSDPDEDAVLFHNTGPNAVTVQSLTIGNGAWNLFSLNGVVGPVTIQANSYAIFAGVDGSDTGFGPLVNFTLNGQNLSYNDPTGPGFGSGALHGNGTFGSADETVPWTLGYSNSHTVPEPAATTIFLLGIAGIAVCRYRLGKPAKE